MYKIIVEKNVYKDLDLIPKKDLDKIYETIKNLEVNPRTATTRKLTGRSDRYRIRKGDYRIIYTIDDKRKMVTIFFIRHRKDVYKRQGS